MMETMKVRLGEGKRLRHPETGHVLGPEPIVVPKNGFWTRRVNDGAVVVVPDDAAKAKPGKAATGNGSNQA